MSFIQDLQKKPDSQKKKILISSLVILMLGVVSIWFWQVKRDALFLPQEESAGVPFGGIKNELENFYNNSTKEIKSFKENLINQ